MKNFKILFTAFALLLFGFSANAQSCCKKTETTKETCCSKPAESETSSLSEEALNTKTMASLEHFTQESFKVYGNCVMCKKRIEGALSEVKGIQSAVWDTETKILTVSFDEKATTLNKIHKEIAAVGHDTDKQRAKDGVYDKLPGCCKYERVKV
jgi:copper chaperone CopZ